MLTREKYCAVCGCLLSLPDIRDPVNPDPDESPLLILEDPYDSRILPREMTLWLKNFRVVGCWAEIDSSLVNISAEPNFFVSPPAYWDYGYGGMEPECPTIDGQRKKVTLYEAMDDLDGMLFPIHQACLDLIDRMCQIHQQQDGDSTSIKPKTLMAMCKRLTNQRESNYTSSEREKKGYRYANSGGIEWSHDYYGARQFWADEWDTEPGWELLCADPSSLQIPHLDSFFHTELPVSSSGSGKQMYPIDHLSDRLPWLFPEEAARLAMGDTSNMIDDENSQSLLAKADLICADEGGSDDQQKKLAALPLGLKNRWRIWKILDGITLADQ